VDYDGTTKELAEASYLAKCHRTKKRVPLTKSILAAQSFFVASGRPIKDVWVAFRDERWNDEKTEVIGSEIHSALRDYLASLQNERCCYCAMKLQSNAHSRPIEHVLSRQKFPKFSLHFWNLAVACSRCNGFKLADGGDTFAADLDEYPLPKDFLRDFHPRFHRYEQHVRFISVADNSFSFIAYVGWTDQGRQLVTTLLKRVAYETALESNDPRLAADIKLIWEQLDQRHGQVAMDRVEEFQKTLRELMANQAAKLAR
tara:strand:- start:19317 stop:20090 length:774 start_codon:yes stop_codon:yes gene_type:complete